MIKEKERDDNMSTIFNTIPTLNNHPTPNNSHGLPPYLTYWEIILNQQLPETHHTKYIDDLELFIEEHLRHLYNQNALFIANPLTGEIIWHYNTTTGEEYKVEGF